ncbi:MAG: hypothetical protein GKS06_08070 [Acidobacteria bacterium]|nr:hypothetical protein [Acidobacteriota bacterium]
MNLIAVAIRRPVTTVMFFLGTGLLGLISLDQLRVELIPEVVFPEVVVVLQQRAMSPEQVERELVLPAEGAVGTVEGAVTLDPWLVRARHRSRSCSHRKPTCSLRCCRCRAGWIDSSPRFRPKRRSSCSDSIRRCSRSR